MSELGTVTRVQLNPDQREVSVDVNLSYDKERENIPFRTPAPGVWFVPRINDTVEVTETGAGRYIAHSPIQAAPFPFPDNVSQGDIIMKSGPDTTIRMDRAGDVTIEGDGDINLNGDNVYVNGEHVSTESHTH